MPNETDNKYCDKCKVLLTPWESFGPLFMEVTPNIFTCISCLRNRNSRGFWRGSNTETSK